MITLNLTLAQVNTVLGALGSAPYIQVTEVIDAIRTQATPQISGQKSVENLETAVDSLETAAV